MTIADWLMVVAVVLSPIIAVQVQKKIESFREKRGRKLQLFRTLMATRGSRLSPLHVEALNLIDIEFTDETKVTDAWKLLLDNFSNYPQDPNAKDYESRLATSNDKANDLLADLLYEMSKTLGYKFDKVLLKRGCYSPKGHNDIEIEKAVLRRGLLEILIGQRRIPISVDEEKGKDAKIL